MGFRVNFMGTVNTIQAAYASVTRKPGGRIVLVSSQAGQVGIFGYTGYSASKFALRGLAEALQVRFTDAPDRHVRQELLALLSERPWDIHDAVRALLV